ncbi:hypothetical protein I3842_14G078800 [Carya illinoinensis]|uniref:Small subunit processome component 20 homolog n=1 Tax=Carya illinoinensis TaxID=32201 RepID=A0A922D9R4_CARIL|nr:hypothetical protein I3842_14G078800 [Carya illinoinensis]
MATTSHAQAVKSLNKSPGHRRFVFKTFSQRVEEIEIDVYKSLDEVKPEPSEGSSFFRDCLIEWRELNTAEDFISFYVEIMPLVQTLPLVLLHKELIVSKLLSSLHMKARLSLEPILRLIAALSRDLLVDFIPFMPRIADSLASLLQSGADREPEIIEQIFISWSYIMMYLQKYLIRDLVYLLKVTVKLRFYPKDYVQEFMAEALSFLLRNAPDEQLQYGIKRIMSEVVKKPLPTRKLGVSALLCYVMRGASSRFHSRAERVSRQLMDSAILGSEAVLEVVISAFQRLCEDIEAKELDFMLKYLYKKITNSVIGGSILHLSNLLSLLISIVQIHNGRMVYDYQSLLEHAGFLMQNILMSSGITKAEKHQTKAVDKILELMLCILNGLHNKNNMPAISDCSLQWSPVFRLRNSSLLNFIRELLQKDPCILYIFRVNILSALSDLIETSKEEVLFLLLSFCEIMEAKVQGSNFSDSTSGEVSSKIQSFLQEAICYWIGAINDIVHGDSSCSHIHETELALLWGMISCYPRMIDNPEMSSYLIDLIDALDRLLMIEAGSVAGLPKQTWQSVIGAALSSYNKSLHGKESQPEETSKFLYLAKRYTSSAQVLSAVADYLDIVYGPTVEAHSSNRKYHPELSVEKAVDAVMIFADNLRHSNKGIRFSTLRILCHYEPLSSVDSTDDQAVGKKTKSEVAQGSHMDSQGMNVLQLLLSIEETSLSISTSRKVILWISRIQMGLPAGRVPRAYVPLVLNGIIGVLNNRFSYLWNPALECLAVLLSQHVRVVWDEFISCLEQYQSIFHTSKEQDRGNSELHEELSDIVQHFYSFVTLESDSTSYATVLSLLLQSLQKIPNVVESHSQQFISLFLKFLGYNLNDLMSVGLFDSRACKGREWKGVLKEWLNLLKIMRNPRSFYQSQFLREVLQNRLLDENDAEIQMKVLDCLLIWKEDFLLPYDQHLRNLISVRYLREELTTWSLSKESNLIEEQHRPYVVPIVIHLLMPKVRKLKALASRKNASVHHRKAVLGFIAELDIMELPLFFALLIKPLQISSEDTDSSPENSMDQFQGLSFLKYFTVDNITALSWKKRYGFMHVIEDILGVFDEFHIRPFLDLLMGCVVRVLGSCTSSIDAAKCDGLSSRDDHSVADLTLLNKDSAPASHGTTSSTVKQFKDLRSLCLKIISLFLDKYEDYEFGCEFWDLFFTSVKPLVDGFKQEGSSSEKPSSLFSCFVAMSRSHRLVSLLSREKNLVRDIFSMLSIKSASEAIVSCVLKFVENLLNLDSEFGDEDASTKRVLLPNLEALICSLHCLFQSDSATKRKLVKCPGERDIRIFKLLSKYIKDPLLARKFVDVLLPFIAKRAKVSHLCSEAVQVIREIVPVLGSDSTKKVLTAVSPLLTSVELEMRLSICHLLDSLAEADPTILSMAKLVHDLNATSAAELGSLDYDTIINAYEKICVNFFYSIQEDHALVILSHCVYDMSSEELILRHSAYRSLLSFVEFSALILCQDGKGQQEMTSKLIMLDKGCWTRASIQRIIKFLLKHMGVTLSGESNVKKEWIDLLREMVLKLPEVENLTSLGALCSKDAEVDFFNNIVHLQRHRRARALSRFRNVINTGNMSEGIINKVFVPLFFSMLFDAQEGKGENVRAACIEALGSISGHVEWNSYYGLLVRCLQGVTKNPDKQKLFLRLTCSILDNFHFSEISNSQKANESLENGTGEGTISRVSSAILQECSTSTMLTEIQASLSKTVLPKMQKLLNSDSDKVNVNISLAALKLLKLLPADIMDSLLPSIIHRISNFLKNRLESIRDEARSALAACLKELGLEYLQFIVRVLRATLKRGYELHVLGYTLNFILSKSLLVPACGKLDYCLEDLLSVVENDILGDVAEQKEVEKIASKMKETKTRKSLKTLELIAESITFKTHALKLLSPVTTHLQKQVTPKVKTELERMLNHIAIGIDRNPSVDETGLFIFLYGLIEDGIKDENGEGEHSLAAEAKKHHRNDSRGKRITSGRILNVSSHLIIVFALRILHKRIKSLKLGKCEHGLSMLDPFVMLLVNCLDSKYEDILAASLSCLTPLVRLPLPSLESQADKMKEAVLAIAQNSVTSSSLLMQSCLRLLAVLLRSTRITLSSDQLHNLIQLPLFVDIEKNPSNLALSLLKAIVSRKLVVAEIYDLVTQVGELMVTSQVDSIRKKCSQILLQFLLDYQLSVKRLQQHLDFLLSNLRYEHSTGREAVLEMLHAIIVKFPRKNVDEQSQTLFVHLVVCLANDHDSRVRSMTGAAIKKLIGCISSHSLHSILEYTLSWYSEETQQLWSAAAQVLGFLVEVMKKGFERHVNRVLSVTRKSLQSAIGAVTCRQLDFSEEPTVAFWREAYYSLVMLEKMLHQFPDLCFQSDLEDIWEAICELLLHPHMWLRHISSRLIALYFASAIEAPKENEEKSLQAYFLMKPSRLFIIAVSLCCQLKTQLDDSSTDLITQNLVFTICGMNSLMAQMEFWSTLEQHEQVHFLEAFQLLDSRKGKSVFLSLTSGVSYQKDPGQSNDIRHAIVSYLLKRMGKIALQMEAVQMKIIFNCFSKLSSQISRDDCLHYVPEILLPLYKVCEGFSGKVIPDDIKQLAEEVRETIKNTIGIQNFVQVYSEIRKNLKAKRDKRKQEEKVMAVVNPMRNAKRKLRIAAKHRANKKRKIMTMKMGRWVHQKQRTM